MKCNCLLLWKIVELSNNHQLIDSQWIYKLKYNSTNDMSSKKSSKSYLWWGVWHNRKTTDYNKIFLPLVNYSATIQLVYTLAILFDICMNDMDVVLNTSSMDL